MNIFCVRKEDDLYYQGPFWIIAESFKDILRGDFKIIGEKYVCNYDGNYTDDKTSKNQKTHKYLWNNKYKLQYNQDDYTFYPRGKVSIYQGTAFIHINSRCNIPKVIDKIINDYNISKLEIEIDLNDTYQGSHYDFKLK